VRVSQVGGREGDSFLSPDVQREKIQAWASYRDYTVTRWYTDLDVSGRAGVRRPEFARMMDDAAAGAFDVVAVYRLTRFGRSVADAARHYAELERLGVDLVSVTEDIDTTTAGGKFMRNVLFAMAEFESQRIGEEWRNVHLARRRRGIAHVARPMFGYRTEGAVIVGVDQAEARAVREIFARRARGENLGQLQAWLQQEGYRPKRLANGDRLARSVVSAMLKNPLYAGLVRTSDGELVEATHEALVPRDLFEQVQRTWSKAVKHARHDRSAALLSGLAVCSGCGYRMSHDGTRYRCRAHDLSHTCPRPVTIRSEPADEHVERLFLRRFDPRRMPHGGRLHRTRQQQAWERKVRALRERADELTRALDALADQRYMKGTLSADEYDRQFARYAGEREGALEQADELAAMIDSVRPLNTNVLSLWPRLGVREKRQALRLLVSEVTVKPAPAPGRHGADPAKRLEIGWVS
jgi:site-specific DNA recombinase